MPLKILMVEDCQDDAELTAAELRRSGFQMAFERVDSEVAMRAALLKQSWDIVLSDYSMPNFSALAALDVLQETGRDIPFIIVSGAIGESTAVAAMKKGANDYIMKGNLARLGPAIERELRDAEVRRERQSAEAKVKLQQQRLAGLHDINLAITSTLELRQVLTVLLDKVNTLLPYSAVTLRLRDPVTGELDSVACRNLDEALWRSQALKGRTGLTDVVIQTKAPVIVRDIQCDPRVLSSDFVRQEGLASFAGLPLIANEEAIGVLSFYTRDEHEFSDEEVTFLATLAGQAAIAIHNSQLYQQAKNQTEELALTNRELEKSNRVKSEFLSVMSHELRTPLNLVMGYTQMLKDRMVGEINPEQERVLGKLLSQAKTLLSMISGILEATNIGSKATITASAVDLVEFLHEFKSDYEIPLGKNLTLQWEIPAALPEMVTDREKLVHILQNLIGNAVKFTDAGQVTISAHYLAATQTIELKVADTGIGIDANDRSAIFDMFFQVDSSDSRSYGGVGLGLFIVKTLTTLLGGSVEVESELNKGSLFTVSLPLRCQAETAAT